jgi:hypothetical protein
MITDSQELNEKADELEEIRDQILELVEMADRILRDTPVYRRARVYWLAHLKINLTQDHGYLDSSMNMDDTIQELRKYALQYALQGEDAA